MAHHKRKGPKSSRAGCLLCKPHKRQGAPLDQRERFSALRRRVSAKEQIVEATTPTIQPRAGSITLVVAH